MVKKMYLLLPSGERVGWSGAGRGASASVVTSYVISVPSPPHYVSCRPVSSGSGVGRGDFKRCHLGDAATAAVGAAWQARTRGGTSWGRLGVTVGFCVPKGNFCS